MIPVWFISVNQLQQVSDQTGSLSMYGLLWEVALGATAWSKSCQEVSLSINGGQAHNLCTPQGKSTGALEYCSVEGEENLGPFFSGTMIKF